MHNTDHKHKIPTLRRSTPKNHKKLFILLWVEAIFTHFPDAQNVKFAVYFQICIGECGGTGTAYWSLESCLSNSCIWKMGVFEQCRHTQTSIHTGYATALPLRRNVYQVTLTMQTRHSMSTPSTIHFLGKVYEAKRREKHLQ